MGYQKTSSVILKNYIDKRAVVKEANIRGLNLFKESKQRSRFLLVYC